MLAVTIPYEILVVWPSPIRVYHIYYVYIYITLDHGIYVHKQAFSQRCHVLEVTDVSNSSGVHWVSRASALSGCCAAIFGWEIYTWYHKAGHTHAANRVHVPNYRLVRLGFHLRFQAHVQLLHSWFNPFLCWLKPHFQRWNRHNSRKEAQPFFCVSADEVVACWGCTYIHQRMISITPKWHTLTQVCFGIGVSEWRFHQKETMYIYIYIIYTYSRTTTSNGCILGFKKWSHRHLVPYRTLQILQPASLVDLATISWSISSWLCGDHVPSGNLT